MKSALSQRLDEWKKIKNTPGMGKSHLPAIFSINQILFNKHQTKIRERFKTFCAANRIELRITPIK